MQNPRRERGFLLVELLIALAILAVPLAAFMRTINQSIDNTAGLRDRSIALWIAQDQLALHQMRRDWPETKTVTGTREMAGRNWRWQEKVLTTPAPQMRRIEVEVRDADGNNVLARLVGFVRDPNSKP